MNDTGRRADRMGPSRISSPASMFEKVLRAFAEGDLHYADVQLDLKRLLSSGAPPQKLLEVLQRWELIEPLPDYAHAGVMRLINEAIDLAEAENAEAEAAPDQIQDSSDAAASAASPVPALLSDLDEEPPLSPADGGRSSYEERLANQDDDYQALSRAYEHARDAGSAATARVLALTADLTSVRAALESEQRKSREFYRALVERTATDEAARSRGEEILRESQRYQTELQASRDSLLAHEKTLAQLRHSLGEREAQLAALQQEHAALVPTLESRAQVGARQEAELQASRARISALTAELAAAHAATQAGQSKIRELDGALAEKAALQEATLSQREEAQRETERYRAELRTVRDALAARDKTIAQVRHSLVERDAQLAALEKERAKIVAGLEVRAKSAESELQATRTRLGAVASELKASQDAATVLNAQRERGDSHLQAVRAELGAVQARSNSYLEVLETREWRRGFDQNRFREMDARGDAAGAGAGPAGAHAGAQAEQQFPVAQPPVAAQPPAAAQAPGSAQLPVAGQMPGSAQPLAAAQAQAAAPLQAAARTRESDARQPLPKGPPPSARVAQPPTPKRGEVRKPGTIARAAGVGAALVALVWVAWFLSHRASTPAKAPVASSGVLQKPGTLIRDCPTCPGLTILPQGRFKQGSAGAENGSASFEKPLHWVAIGRPIAMSTSAVTLDEFRAFITATGRDMQGCDVYDGEWKHRPESSWENPGFVQAGSHPVTCTSWDDAKAYAAWLSAQTGHRYRLPSASEWEYAARAGSDADQPWGANGSGACASANVADQSAARRYPGWTVFGCDDGYIYTAPVGSFKASAFGLNDMLGNVFQWTEDCWHEDYKGAPIDGSARTDGDCSEHELRGGSWFSTPAFVRAGYRNHFAANYRTSSVGIRLVRELAP
jgi:formylglycine-generating enzyme required for sulfatase activity